MWSTRAAHLKYFGTETANSSLLVLSGFPNLRCFITIIFGLDFISSYCLLDLVLLTEYCLRIQYPAFRTQADQRKGRTGRTCDGTVIRLISRHVYHSFPKCETPQMQLFSLRKQVLMITSAESKAINDPICKVLYLLFRAINACVFQHNFQVISHKAYSSN